MGILLGLATAAARDPELAAALSRYLDLPRQMLRQMLERALARGEIAPGRDLGLIPDTLIGLNILRACTGEVPDRDFVRRVFEELIYPLVTGLAWSRCASGDNSLHAG